MIKKNNKIDTLQILILGSMIGNALFVGMGNIITVLTVKNNTWFVGICSLIIGIIPVILLNIYMSHQPNLNIFEKNRDLFGKFIGEIINIAVICLVIIMLIINIWSFFNFAGTKYLTETPILFIGFLFTLPLIYACTKGIETISRTIFILFFIILLIHIIITSSLLKFVDIENLKPILKIKSGDIITGIRNFIFYAFSPFITLTIIPKNNIINKEKLGKFSILGYVLAAFFMFIVFTMTMLVVGYNITSMYRYPEYYVIKKISIGQAFDNVENFLSIHWMLNIFSCAVMCLYFVKEYFIQRFKVKKIKIEYIIIILIVMAALFISINIIRNSTQENEFMRYMFPYVVGFPLIIFLFISSIAVLIKKIKKKLT